MSETLQVPGEFLREVFSHVERTGKPLLRPQAPTDEITILAWPDRDGSYDLSLDDEYEAVMASIDTWEELIGYLDVPFEELRETLLARGYDPKSIPEPEEMDDEDAPGMHASDLCDLIRDLAPGPTLEEVLAELPASFEWDPGTDYPGLPYNVQEALEWLESRGRIDGVAETEGGRPGWTVNETWVPSATALSCLQYVLDRLDRRVWIRVS